MGTTTASPSRRCHALLVVERRGGLPAARLTEPHGRFIAVTPSASPAAVVSVRAAAPMRMALWLSGSSELQALRPSGLPLLLDWRSTIPAWFFCRSAGTRVPQRRGSLAAVTSTRPAVGVPVAWPSWCATPCRASTCSSWHQLPGDQCLPRVPTGLPQHVRGEPLQTSTAIAHAAHFTSTIRRLGPAAVICDLNSHHELRDGCSPSTTAGEDLAATPTGMEIGLSDDPAQATWISGRSVSFPDVTAQRVLRVSH
ncbi:trans-sialidase [Trypanosoma cruzi]|nr:trans-sialidase [Trypanosoma cruzi]